MLRRIGLCLGMAALLLLGACSAKENLARGVVHSGIGYDVEKDDKVAHTWHARCVYDVQHRQQMVMMQRETLREGLQAALNDGADKVAWSGPTKLVLTRTTTRTQYGIVLSSTTTNYEGFGFVVRGWKTTDADIPPGAIPIAAALARVRN